MMHGQKNIKLCYVCFVTLYHNFKIISHPTGLRYDVCILWKHSQKLSTWYFK